MLISFTIENFLSFKERVTLSFLASSKITELDKNFNVCLNDNVLTSLVIFGNNASGKSNLLKAINLGKHFITNSTSFLPNKGIDGVIPFKLDIETIEKPSFFEFEFILNEKYYRYNFSLNKIYIISENLYSKSLSDKRERVLFTRNKQDIRINNFDDRGIKNNVLENHLALSKFALENSKEALEINNFFQKIFIFSDGINSIDTYNLFGGDKSVEFKEFLLSLIGITNSGIDNISYTENKKDISNLPLEFQQIIQEQIKLNGSLNNKDYIEKKCEFLHKITGSDKFANFSFDEESFGTKKVFNLAGSLFNIIDKEMILFIDELDTSLSTKMIKYIIEKFKDKNTGKKAQLVFTSNNTSLLDIKDTFRRDQIYFTKKIDEGNYTDLYNLQSCKLLNDKGELINIRKDLATLEKNYLDNKIKKAKD